MSNYTIDTSNQHPKIKSKDQLEEFLVDYKLYVDFDVFNIHGLIWAKDSEDAYKKMPEGKVGEHYVLERKGVIGAVKEEERRKIHDRLHDIGGGILLP